jgi:uncharacterized membrane protein
MRAKLLFVFPLLLAFGVSAQSPTPIVVQAANSTAAAKSTTSAPVAPDVHSIPEAIKLLEQIKATNEEVLAKQKAALERLGELQDAADQLRIFAKRG